MRAGEKITIFCAPEVLAMLFDSCSGHKWKP
jgi:hypothetical protein